MKIEPSIRRGLAVKEFSPCFEKAATTRRPEFWGCRSGVSAGLCNGPKHTNRRPYRSCWQSWCERRLAVAGRSEASPSYSSTRLRPTSIQACRAVMPLRNGARWQFGTVTACGDVNVAGIRAAMAYQNALLAITEAVTARYDRYRARSGALVAGRMLHRAVTRTDMAVISRG